MFRGLPDDRAQGMYMAHIQIRPDHPGWCRALFSAISQRAEPTAPKQQVQNLIAARRTRASSHRAGQGIRERSPVSTASSATLFIGTIQDMVRMHILSFMEADASPFRAYARKHHHAALRWKRLISRDSSASFVLCRLARQMLGLPPALSKPFVEAFLWERQRPRDITITPFCLWYRGNATSHRKLIRPRNHMDTNKLS